MCRYVLYPDTQKKAKIPCYKVPCLGLPVTLLYMYSGVVIQVLVGWLVG